MCIHPIRGVVYAKTRFSCLHIADDDETKTPNQVSRIFKSLEAPSRWWLWLTTVHIPQCVVWSTIGCPIREAHFRLEEEGVAHGFSRRF
uniref:Uncharacterized protein n=1 Tax=Anopheles arabiensis TaxID=7173 RepID=A0A182IG98_ANOAR